ncbi:hypothetical protein [Pseudomonas batumici]|uniref:hypothetical protein n=1 Tax=Pseudomonas batumici TaxID=226910 RepID=UPI000589F446|nr:hypothetical protein [Pseudomonas batumici]
MINSEEEVERGMDGPWIAFGGAVIALVGTIAVALLSRYTLIQTSKLQMQQARLSVNATSSLALLSQQAEKAAAFFSAIEQLDRLTQGENLDRANVKAVAEKVNIESAMLQPYLTKDLASIVMALARSYDQLAAAEAEADIWEATRDMKQKRSDFLYAYFQNREQLISSAKPAVQ